MTAEELAATLGVPVEAAREILAQQLSATQAGGAPAAPPALRTLLGKYIVLETLGQGGQGIVYRVRHAQLGRIEALKVLRAQGAGAEERSRFEREARILAQLRHPNIVPVYEVGDVGGEPYYTMQFVDGESAGQILKRTGPLPPRAAMILGRDVARALQAAHGRGITHRDVKPANILVCPEESLEPAEERPREDSTLALSTGKVTRFRVLLTDFGLARVEGEQSLTQESGVIVGTLAYMSPEQANAERRRIGERSDVYGLGATLYHLLTGRAPFEGESALELIRKVTSESPPSPRERLPALSKDIETIVLKAMEKDPARRYATAQAMGEDIERYLRGEAIRARPASPAYRAWLFVRRHRTLSTVTAVLLAGIASLGISWYVTPGTINLNVSPRGAVVVIGKERWKVDEPPLQVRLPAGVHVIRVEAPEHAPQTREALVERGQEKDLAIPLSHHQGRLDADAFPPAARIDVDGVPRGAALENLPLDTGEHVVRARWPRHFEREQRIHVRRGERVRTFLWLDDGVLWSETSSSIVHKNPWILGDVDRDGAVDVAYQELLHLVIRSCRDEAIVRRVPAASRNTWACRAASLGGEIGDALLLYTEERDGLFVTCVDPDRPAAEPVAWQWEGPRHPWDDLGTGIVALLEDLNGDGAREVAAAGQDGEIFVIDGRLGRTTAGPVQLPVRPEEALPTRSGLVITGPSLPPGTGWTVVCVRLPQGAIAWTRASELGRLIEVEADGDGAREVLSWCTSKWEVLDPETGEPRRTGRLAATERNLLRFGCTDLDGDGADEILYGLEDRQLLARRLRDGGTLWKVTDLPPASLAVVNLQNEWPGPMPGSVAYFGEDRLVLLDARTGERQWEFPGACIGLAHGDWDGDGRAELFVGISGEGVACLDPDGRVQWRLRMDVDARPAAVLPDVDGDGLSDVLILSGAGAVGVVRGPRVLWSRKAPMPLQANPIVLDADSDGRPEVLQSGHWSGSATNFSQIACFDGATGAKRWTSPGPGHRNRPPGVGRLDGSPALYFQGRDRDGGYLFGAVRADDGRLAWSARGDQTTAVYAIPAIVDLNGDAADDIVLARWEARDIVAIDGRSGGFLWRHATGEPNMGGAGVADLDGDGRPDVVAPSMDGSLYALRGGDGALLWSGPLGVGGSRAPPTLADLTGDGVADAVVCTRREGVRAFDGRTGAPIGAIDGGPATEALGRAAVRRDDGGTVIYAPMGGAGVVAWDWDRRRLLWKAPADEGVTASPIVADLDGDGLCEVVVGTYDGDLFVLDAATGDQLWGLPLREKDAPASDVTIEADPAVADLDGDGVLDVVVATADGVLIAISGRGTFGARARWRAEAEY